MKRILSALALILAVLMLPGCALIDDLAGGGPSGLKPFTVEERDPVSLPSAKPAEGTQTTPAAPESAEATSAPAEEVPDPAALLQELLYHVGLINSCYAGTCGAEFDDTALYRRVYESDEAFMNEEPPIDVVSDLAMPYADRHDLSDAALYEITNYQSNSDAFNYLTNYMTWQLAESLYLNEFLEMNGKLYIVFDSRGYGTYQLDPSTAVLTEVGAGHCVMQLDGVLFDERTPYEIGFLKVSNGWQAYYIMDLDC